MAIIAAYAASVNHERLDFRYNIHDALHIPMPLFAWIRVGKMYIQFQDLQSCENISRPKRESGIFAMNNNSHLLYAYSQEYTGGWVSLHQSFLHAVLRREWQIEAL